MNHWILVAQDIWFIFKFILPFIGSLMIINGFVPPNKETFGTIFIFTLGWIIYIFGCIQIGG